MHKDTANAIAILISLFTDEEKEGLKITLGAREISLEEQFVGRWCFSKPLYLGNHFLYKAAHIINGNKLLFHRVIEFQKPEFQQRLRTLLANPDSYVKMKTTKTDNIKDTKTLSTGQTTAKSSSRTANKSRMGSSESGQEYVELDKIWDREDNQYLAEGLERERLALKVNVDANKGLEGLTMGVINNPEDPVSDFVDPNENENLESYEPALQSINVNQTRSKTIAESQGNNISLSNQHDVLDGRVVAKDVAEFEAIQLMTIGKFKDPRETAFQKLDVLFTAPCL